MDEDMREEMAMAVPRRWTNHIGTLTLNTRSYTDIRVRSAQNKMMSTWPFEMRPIDATVMANSGHGAV